MPFTPIPAIDIRGGRCVRLRQGDFSRETIYGDDPVAMAQRWQDEGAPRLHIVDLDGARDGVRANASVIDRLLHTVSVPVQLGGGIRTLETAQELIDAGADRVIMGTAAVEHPDALGAWLAALGAARVVVAVDARGTRVASRGWQTASHLDFTTFCQQLAQSGVARVLYTDIARDGVSDGPNVEATRAVAKILPVLASGGISSAKHLRALAEAGAEGAILGTALYSGKLKLEEALGAC
ncbi:MAG TPA: 1-(5-phosphoribosyl)-5-[(5-phosphoribosylamino)methylideneamino]imidazole-4-carboxamide isomerase [Chloroflexota bacterium]|nr:1-(5-phosphoribosyl)-5-[(5-phosphoribosylamino)methylideneamino]imidazole-4-carboxamide isomerase [Chloroflexota bacterium]